MAKRPLADVLWEAANRRLAVSDGGSSPDFGVFRESCCAVLEVIRPGWFRDLHDYDSYVGRRPIRFLNELGCDPHSTFFVDNFSAADGQRQGARYLWLLLAMHVAEDEGIMVEVWK